MIKKISLALLLMLAFGASALNAASLERQEAQSLFAKVISGKWDSRFFVRIIRQGPAFDSNNSWTYAVEHKSDWASFAVTKIRNRTNRVSVSGYFKNEKGLGADQNIYEFVLVKRSAGWQIAQVFFKNFAGQYFKFDFKKNVIEKLPEVEGLDTPEVEGLDAPEVEVEGL